ncbi:Sodium-dependent phosphate transport protein 2A [Anabarilius grahami]|uniref:Sodium-dependent phosphate transport protein 2A n=1 Tax=Anabarilius grahami TaxID=495550 RepID=A0A3N0Y491_ANAGA|nr:Sodium-dependent phosphate transport protein 2A [Anabarilius grahami]
MMGTMGKHILIKICKIPLLLLFLYMFICSLDILSSAFQLAGVISRSADRRSLAAVHRAAFIPCRLPSVEYRAYFSIFSLAFASKRCASERVICRVRPRKSRSSSSH